MQAADPHTREVYGITLLSSQHRDIRRLKRQHQTHIHGNKSWGASFLLMDYLQQHPPAFNSHILDVGCGWGLAGIHCARQVGAEVLAVDADAAVFPFLDLHASYNAVNIDTHQCYFEDITEQQLAGVDCLIAADICFWDELADTVFELLARACAAGVGKIIIADPERPPFFNLAERCMDEFYAELIPRRITVPRRISGALLIIENN